MGLFGLGKPAWKHKDPEVRLRALHDGAVPPGSLRDLALEDPDPRVRAACASRIGDGDTLTVLLAKGDDAVRRIAKERLSGVAESLLRTKPLAECRSVLDQVGDQKSLAELSVQARDGAVREAAFAKLLAQEEPSQALLAMVAIQDAEGALALRALDRLERAALKNVAKNAKVERVRDAATARREKLEQERERPSPEKRRKARLAACQPLVEQAQRLAVTSDLERAEGEWTTLLERWAAACVAEDDLPLDDAVRELDARVQRARRDFCLRRDTWRELVAQTTAAGEALAAELAALPAAPAGSARADLAARWQPPAELAARLGALAARIAAELDRLFPAATAASGGAGPAGEPAVAVARDPARDARLEAIAVEAEGLAAGGEFEAKFRFQQLHKEWSGLSADLPAGDALKQRFLTAYAAWKDRRRAGKEERDQATRERLEVLGALASEAEGLAAKADGLALDDAAAVKTHTIALKDLQARWKAVGPVRPDRLAAVRERFRAALDRAWKPVASQREAEDWDRFTHLARAEELIAAVEALGACEDWPKVAAGVKDAHKRWKELGGLPRERAQEAWTRFKAACDAQFERCRPWFAEQDAARVANLEAKLALIAELEALAAQGTVGLVGSPADLEAKRATGERVKAIQGEWKAIGPVPRERDEEVWTRFRALCDGFFKARRAEFDALHAERVDNLNRKLALIVAAEDLAAQVEAAQRGESPSRPTPEVLKQVKSLQDSWKNIGHVPRERMDELWSRWRAACDRVYASFKEHFAALDAERQKNLEAKLAMIQEAEELAQHENARWFKDDVRELQRKWRDVGHVPRDRLDEVTGRFEAACSKVLGAE